MHFLGPISCSHFFPKVQKRGCLLGTIRLMGPNEEKLIQTTGLGRFSVKSRQGYKHFYTTTCKFYCTCKLAGSPV